MQELRMKRIMRSRDIKTTLSSLPKDLDSTYERILTSVDSSLADEATAALKWLACASRPLFLEELAEACIIRPEDTEPFDEYQRFSGYDILELLPGLTRIDPTPDPSTPIRHRYYTVSLAHFSVMEYLSSQRILSGSACSYHVNISLAQRHITRSCLVYIAHVLDIQPTSDHTDTEYPLSLYAYSRWFSHAALVSNESLEDVSASAMDLFTSPRACLKWNAYARRTRHEEAKSDFLTIPFDAYQTPLWPRYYLLCHSITAGNEVIVNRLLDGGFQIRGGSVLGEPLKLAIVAGRENIAKRILAAGYLPSKVEMLFAARCSSEGLLSSVLAKAAAFGLTDMLLAVDTAIVHAKFRNADLLLCQLFYGTLSYRENPNAVPAETRLAVCYQILRKAMRLDSSSLVNYLLQHFGRNTIHRLDMGPLFLRAVIQGKEKMAAALKTCPWVHLSEDELIFQCNWSNVMVREYICADLLEFYYRCCQVGASLPENKCTAFKGRSPSWGIPIKAFKSSSITRCKQSWEVLFRYFEIFQESGLYLPYKPPNAATSLPRQLNSLDRLLVYSILTGPHFSALWTLYSTELICRRGVRSFTSYVSQFSHYSTRSLPYRMPPADSRLLLLRLTWAEMTRHLIPKLERELKDRSTNTDNDSCLLLDLSYCLIMWLQTGILSWSSGIPEDVNQDHGKILQRLPRCHSRSQRRVLLNQGFQVRNNLWHWGSVDRISTEVVEASSFVSLFLVNTLTLANAAESTSRDPYFRWTRRLYPYFRCPGRLYHPETGLGLSPDAVPKWLGLLSNYILRPSNNGGTARPNITRPAADILQPTGPSGACFEIFKEGEDSTAVNAWAIMNRTFEVVMWDLDNATKTFRVPHYELRPLLDWALEQTIVLAMVVQELA
jgi:hypothetical protein